MSEIIKEKDWDFLYLKALQNPRKPRKVRKTRQERDEIVFSLRQKGLKLREIAEKYGVTRQRIQQILGKTGTLYEPVVKKCKCGKEFLVSYIKRKQKNCSRKCAYPLMFETPEGLKEHRRNKSRRWYAKHKVKYLAKMKRRWKTEPKYRAKRLKGMRDYYNRIKNEKPNL